MESKLGLVWSGQNSAQALKMLKGLNLSWDLGKQGGAELDQAQPKPEFRYRQARNSRIAAVQT